HGDRYNYDLVVYKNLRTKVKIVCKDHGVFEQVPDSHTKGHGCPHCAGNTQWDTGSFILKAKEVHGDKFDYSLVDYKTTSHRVTILCPYHGASKQFPREHLRGIGCRRCGDVEKGKKRRL